MEISFTKLSDDRHRVAVLRGDGSSDAAELESRSFLRHDLAHYAVESEVPIGHGFWGSVADGAALSGEGIAGPEAQLAESLAGPIQTLMRDEADAAAYLRVISAIAPQLATPELAARIHEHVRRLRGHWKATPFGSTMQLAWPGRLS